MLIVCVSIVSEEDGHVFKDYTFGIGVVSAIANIIQWSPQIYKTFKTFEIGSLSILMLLLQGKLFSKKINSIIIFSEN